MERVGGIYALERLMAESLDDHWTVVEVLATFSPPARRARTAGGRVRGRWGTRANRSRPSSRP